MVSVSSLTSSSDQPPAVKSRSQPNRDMSASGLRLLSQNLTSVSNKQMRPTQQDSPSRLRTITIRWPVVSTLMDAWESQYGISTTSIPGFPELSLAKAQQHFTMQTSR